MFKSIKVLNMAFLTVIGLSCGSAHSIMIMNNWNKDITVTVSTVSGIIEETVTPGSVLDTNDKANADRLFAGLGQPSERDGSISYFAIKDPNIPSRPMDIFTTEAGARFNAPNSKKHYMKNQRMDGVYTVDRAGGMQMGRYFNVMKDGKNMSSY